LKLLILKESNRVSGMGLTAGAVGMNRIEYAPGGTANFFENGVIRESHVKELLAKHGLSVVRDGVMQIRSNIKRPQMRAQQITLRSA